LKILSVVFSRPIGRNRPNSAVGQFFRDFVPSSTALSLSV